CDTDPATDTNNSVMRVMRHAQADGAEQGVDGPGHVCHSAGAVSGNSVRRETGGSKFDLIRQADQLATVLQALGESALVGVDCETTGLDPRRDRIRLLQLATDCGLFILDLFQVDARPLFELLARRTLVLHNAAFDLAFLAQLGFEPGAVKDTMLLSRLLHG